MGILRCGLFGGIEKKTGGIIGRTVNGQNVISALYAKPVNAKTDAQLDQLRKLGLVATTLKWFKCLIEVGFRQMAGKSNAFNACVKFNFKHLLTGNAPDYVIDYSKLMFSKGNLDGACMAVATLREQRVVVNWLPVMETWFSRNTDRITIVAFCPDSALILVKRHCATRAELQVELSLPGKVSGKWHIWMSLASENEKEVSNSVYLGHYRIHI